MTSRDVAAVVFCAAPFIAAVLLVWFALRNVFLPLVVLLYGLAGVLVLASAVFAYLLHALLTHRE